MRALSVSCPGTMLRLGAALALMVGVAACGDQPSELRTIAVEPAVVPVNLTRPTREPVAETTTTTTTAPPVSPPTVPPPPPPTTTTTTRETYTQAPIPAPRGDCLGWGDLIAAHFPADQVGTACRVMACETGGTGDPTIHNPSSSASGLFQFLDSTWASTTGLSPPAAAHPAGTQIAAAASLWRSSGWSPWSCY